jgi:hypothetical protein
VSLVPDKPPAMAAPAPSRALSINPAATGASVKALMKDHVRVMGDIQATQIEILRSTLAQQRNSVTNAVGSVAAKIAAQTDEFNAIMGQFTNELGKPIYG